MAVCNKTSEFPLTISGNFIKIGLVVAEIFVFQFNDSPKYTSCSILVAYYQKMENNTKIGILNKAKIVLNNVCCCMKIIAYL